MPPDWKIVCEKFAPFRNSRMPPLAIVTPSAVPPLSIRTKPPLSISSPL